MSMEGSTKVTKENRYTKKIINDNPDNSINTIREYEKVMKRIFKYITGDDKIKSMTIFKDTEKINEYILTFKPKYRQLYYSAIIKYLRSYVSYKKYLKYYVSEFEKLTTEINNTVVPTSAKTDNENKNWLTWKNIIKRRDQLINDVRKDKNKHTNKIKLLQATILSLYTYIPPRRNSDYYLLRVLDNYVDDYDVLDEKYNYVDMKHKKLVMLNFKTRKSEGKQIIDMPQELYDILETYISKNYKNLHGAFLFSPHAFRNVPYSNSWVTKILNSIFVPRKISSTMLRHIYLTDTYGGTYDALEDTAKNMAHSIAMQKQYIRK